MKGTVKYLNKEDGMAAIETAAGQFTILGVMGDAALDLGDEVSGDLEGDGAVALNNDSKGTAFDAYVEDNAASEDLARQSAG